MKIKTAVTVLFGVLAIGANAQVNSKCEEGLKALQEKTRAHSYDDAAKLLPNLRKTCPSYSVALYTYGQKVLDYKAEAAATDSDRKAFTEDLLSLLSEQQKNFPASDAAIKKALLLHEKKLASDDEVYKMLDTAFKGNQKVFTDFNALELYFNLFLARYEAGDKGVTKDAFIEKYGAITEQLVYAQTTLGTQINELEEKHKTQPATPEETEFLTEAKRGVKALDAVNDNITKQSSKYFSCEMFESFYGKNFDSYKTNAARLQGIVVVLYENKCYTSAILQQAAEQWYKLSPTVKSSYYMANIALRQHKDKEAIQYFDQMALLEKEPSKKAAAYNTVAIVCRTSDKAQAKKYAQKAIEADPKSGKAYLFLADLYANAGNNMGDCNFSAFDQKALNWLAIDMAKKAEAAEPKYKATVASVIEGYTKNLPVAADYKAAKKKKGDTVTYGCWINETVTVR